MSDTHGPQQLRQVMFTCLSGRVMLPGLPADPCATVVCVQDSPPFPQCSSCLASDYPLDIAARGRLYWKASCWTAHACSVLRYLKVLPNHL